MSVIVILMLASLTIALLFLGGFVWAVRSGQYEDTCTPSMRMLTEPDSTPSDGVGTGGKCRVQSEECRVKNSEPQRTNQNHQ